MSGSAVVAGAGPAGLSAALGLARLGFSVQVCEEKKGWDPRVCGAFLSPESISHLRWLGIDQEIEALGVPCREVQVHSAGKTGIIPFEDGSNPGLAVSRRDLEEVLRTRAEKEGVQILFGKKVLERPSCDVFVAACGRFSRFRNSHARQKKAGWAAFNAEWNGARQKPGEMSLHFFPNAYVGTLTFKNGITNVSGLVHSDFIKNVPGGWDAVITFMRQRDSALEGILQSAQRSEPFKGIPFLPFGTHFKGGQDYYSVGDNALVGDPFMGEGISRALSSGRMIYEARKNGGDFFEIWKKSYGQREFLGRVFRALLASRTGSRALFYLLMEVPLIRSWVLRRIHR
ncbi:MAG: hypothetical protein A2901_01485 [Elusimicrobia bacterium RIFCSPLOWO2_01_FULL_54_10]|nr:MAG: hypothetical protein A2901_01485 [Elusimicrobia bacterium RIFCSPLOWO2_01_FULL_54_10]